MRFLRRPRARSKQQPVAVQAEYDTQVQPVAVGDVRERIRKEASHQWGHVGGWQLSDWGVPASRVKAWVRTRWLLPRHRGSYAVGHRQQSVYAEIMSAVLALGRDAVASHLAAARIWGMLKLELDAIDVSTPRHLRPRDGIRPHRNSRLSGHVTRRLNIPVTSPEETIVGLAEALYSDRMLRRAINQGLVDRLLTIESLTAHVEASRHRQGIPRIKALLPRATPTRSFLEDDVFNDLLEAGVPKPETNVDVEGEELDLYWRDINFGVDLDSAKYHGNPIAAIIDAEKTARLRARGVGTARQAF